MELQNKTLLQFVNQITIIIMNQFYFRNDYDLNMNGLGQQIGDCDWIMIDCQWLPIISNYWTVIDYPALPEAVWDELLAWWAGLEQEGSSLVMLVSSSWSCEKDMLLLSALWPRLLLFWLARVSGERGVGAWEAARSGKALGLACVVGVVGIWLTLAGVRLLSSLFSVFGVVADDGRTPSI